MPHKSNSIAKIVHANPPTPRITKAARSRKANRLKDEVYREMLLLESNRPGSEMGLALALLRAVVQSDHLSVSHEAKAWLKSICPLGLRMIEASLSKDSECLSKQS